MSKLGSLYIELGQPDGELSGCTCEVGDWAADEIERLNAQVAMLRGALLNWSCVIHHQYSGDKEAMDFLQKADNLGQEVLSATEMKEGV